MHTMEIKCWGTRGSIPTPLKPEEIMQKQINLIQHIIEQGGTKELFGDTFDQSIVSSYLQKQTISLTSTYGGNTTCLEVKAEDTPLIILDAGSGLRELGNDIIERMKAGAPLNPMNYNPDNQDEIHILLSHSHWDHIMGIPFFKPSFIPDRYTLHFYGKSGDDEDILDILEKQQSTPNFPVRWNQTGCGKRYNKLHIGSTGETQIGNSNITYIDVNHPDRAFAYNIENSGKSFMFAPDVEVYRKNEDVHNGMNKNIVKFAQKKGIDVLYHDSAYTPEEITGRAGVKKEGWGHSTYIESINTAVVGNIKRVILAHPDPERSDEQLERILEAAYKHAEEKTSTPPRIDIPYEGMRIYL
jgi:phosphoribosyl 1,2-cyclic phosphodiesterase